MSYSHSLWRTHIPRGNHISAHVLRWNRESSTVHSLETCHWRVWGRYTWCLTSKCLLPQSTIICWLNLENFACNYMLLTPKCSRSQKVVANVFRRYISQGKLFSFLVVFSCTWTWSIYALFTEKTDWKFVSTTPRYGPWSGWNPWVFWLQHYLLWESNNVNDIHIFGASHQIMQLKLVANHVKDRVVLMHLGFFTVFMKENACQMIWRRLRIKIHIPTAWMWFNVNSLDFLLHANTN